MWDSRTSRYNIAFFAVFYQPSNTCDRHDLITDLSIVVFIYIRMLQQHFTHAVVYILQLHWLSKCCPSSSFLFLQPLFVRLLYWYSSEYVNFHLGYRQFVIRHQWQFFATSLSIWTPFIQLLLPFSLWVAVLLFVSGICQALEAFRFYHNFIDLLICMRQVVRKKITQCGLAVKIAFAGQYVAATSQTAAGSHFPLAL